MPVEIHVSHLPVSLNRPTPRLIGEFYYRWKRSAIASTSCWIRLGSSAIAMPLGIGVYRKGGGATHLALGDQLVQALRQQFADQGYG